MNEKVITAAVDVDGVLMECYPPINESIIKKFGLPEDFRIQGVVKSWNMYELPEEIRKYALACMADAEIVKQYTFKKGSRKFVKELYDFVTEIGGKFIFNTHCLNQEVGIVRRMQLETLAKELNINPEYNISVGPKKINAVSDIIIDDHLGNLDVSDAPIKVLFSMFHNRYLDEGNAYRSRCYNDIIKYVKEEVSV